uniref:RRM domain-containing protein n=1 Tax=Compsopogon caeruleus TaxID=31354 RepID=A0A7S1TL02_9RHOD|mmetsp:Transcript_9620/g.19658  ORF Transcript_9620/g.19658 Transcript_9620/m.19658 type:complete len:390 (+) Transcript_9620:715-1884(+)
MWSSVDGPREIPSRHHEESDMIPLAYSPWSSELTGLDDIAPFYISSGIQEEIIPSTLESCSPVSALSVGSSVVRSSARSQPGKIFVGGLSWETNEWSLRNYFEKFGRVLECLIMRDRSTGHPRGFGFVTFMDGTVAYRVAHEKHELDGRPVEAKLALPRNECPTPQRTNGSKASKKVFVGGLPSNCGDTELHRYFQHFGTVMECLVMYDHQTGNSRGFGFVTFSDLVSIDRVMEIEHHKILGKYVEVKRAEPKQVLESRKSKPSNGTPSTASSAMSAGLSSYPGSTFLDATRISSFDDAASSLRDSKLFPPTSVLGYGLCLLGTDPLTNGWPGPAPPLPIRVTEERLDGNSVQDFFTRPDNVSLPQVSDSRQCIYSRSAPSVSHRSRPI